ncbi:MAG: hypothetical protein GX446_02810 [Chthonomonadales bacterium]|nr:hypothetical protein [Chthonomonadales bacterium]
MKQQVNPLVAVLIIAIALAAVWFVYTRVLTGQETGTIGPPSGVSMPPAPGNQSAMPEMPRTKQPDAKAGPKGDAKTEATAQPESRSGK